MSVILLDKFRHCERRYAEYDHGWNSFSLCSTKDRGTEISQRTLTLERAGACQVSHSSTQQDRGCTLPPPSCARPLLRPGRPYPPCCCYLIDFKEDRVDNIMSNDLKVLLQGGRDDEWSGTGVVAVVQA